MNTLLESGEGSDMTLAKHGVFPVHSTKLFSAAGSSTPRSRVILPTLWQLWWLSVDEETSCITEECCCCCCCCSMALASILEPRPPGLKGEVLRATDANLLKLKSKILILGFIDSFDLSSIL